MAYQKVTISGIDTNTLPKLKGEEKRKLLAKAKSGDIQAREEFIQSNLRLVLSIIKKFAYKGENPDDLFQIGTVGLIKAFKNFDTSIGVEFSTYAVPMILGEIKRFLRDNTSIRVSRSLRDIAFRALGAKEEYIAEHGKEPTNEELAKMIEVEQNDLENALRSIQDTVSLYEPAFGETGENVFVLDQVEDKKNTDEAWVEKLSIDEALTKLKAKEKEVLDLRFYKGKTQVEVADEIGISQAQVSRMEKNALKVIKKHI